MEQIKENIWRLNKNQYLKKDKGGDFRIIAPIKKDLYKSFWNTGNKNWFNFLTGGSWYNLFKVIIFILLILGISWTYAHDTRVCRELRENMDMKTGCLDINYLTEKGIETERGLYDEYEESTDLSLFAEDNDKAFSQ